MSQPQQRIAPRYKCRDAEEDRAWTHLYRRAGDPIVAAEVVRQLEADAEARRWHLALYLRCRQTLRERKARLARQQCIGRLVRTMFAVLVPGPWLALHRAFGRRENLAAELPPQHRAEPPVPRIRELRPSPAFIEALESPACAMPLGGDASSDSTAEKAA
jgi:hypothetical protein